MKPEVERVCAMCGEKFWSGINSKQQLCPNCRPKKAGKKKGGESEPGAALMRQAAYTQAQLVALGLPNDERFVAELRALIHEAYRDVGQLPKATFWERWNGDTPHWREYQRQYESHQAIEKLTDREKRMLKELTDVQVSRSKAEAAIIQGRNAVLAAQLEQLRLQEQLRKRQDGNDSPNADTVQDDDEIAADPDTWYATQRQRRKVGGRAMAEQAVISDFLNQVRRVFNHPRLDRNERAVRIRSFMDAFGKGLEDLPAEVRKFLARMDDEQEDA